MQETQKKAKIGIGIVTYNRPDYFKVAMDSVIKHLSDVVDEIVVYDDGSTEIQSGLPECAKLNYHYEPKNKGVAVAKNWCMRKLMDLGCDFIFIMEDDMEILSRNAVVDYLAAYRMSGVDHMMFAHHGEGNQQPGMLVDVTGPIAWYATCVGSYCFYTRQLLEKVGLMDENFVNAWEHVEHTRRSMLSHDVPYGYYPDVVGSKESIREQEDSINHSSIGQQDNPKRIKIIIKGLKYWKNKEGKAFPAQHTLDNYLKILKEMENGTYENNN